jgi:1-deoxy-D-xylulose-5-phosphate reductoisomerase
MAEMKRVAILGSTGSIGTQTLDVILQHPDKLEVFALAAKSNVKLLEQQAAQHRVKHLALYDPGSISTLSIPRGIQALTDLVTMPEADIVVVCVSGVIGLLPTLAAIQAGKQIALASKEVLVAAGEIVMPLLKEKNVRLTPIDSEHSALFQCLQGYAPHQVDSLILTASGGPFRGKKKAELQNVTVEETLRHPTWNMGGKITIDSATLMNKALEIIEAQWLFEIDVDRIDVVIHPQSIVHSFVKFKDSSVLGQLGWPDMRLPIQYALLYPERVPNQLKPWHPLDTPHLTFEPLDEETFRGPRIAKYCAKKGGTLPCTFNAANEAAVQAFLNAEISFLEITDFVEEIVYEATPMPVSLENILEADRLARQAIQKKIQHHQVR